MKAWTMLLMAHADLTRILEGELEGQRGLPLSWYDVLQTLADAPHGRMRMQELAESILLSKSGLTRLFDRMERQGLVRREPFEDDRRGTLAVITSSGRAALRRAAPVHLRGIEEHFGALLTDDEARTMQNALKKVLRAAGRQYVPHDGRL
jgi:DNA-binding MarR family transcriptional regulator